MKRALLPFFLLSFPALSIAAPIGINTNISYWHTSADGKLNAPKFANYSLQLNKETLKSENNFFASIAFEHAIPVLPNILIGYSSIEHHGNGLFTHDYLDGGKAKVAGATDLSHADATLYYEILDNIVSLDLGLTARIFDGMMSAVITEGSISGTNIAGFKLNAPINSTYAFLYLNFAVSIPATGLAVGASANVGDSGDERGMDINAYLNYTSFFGMGINAGYRVLDIKIDSKANSPIGKTDITSDFNVKGPYLGLHYRF